MFIRERRELPFHNVHSSFYIYMDCQCWAVGDAPSLDETFAVTGAVTARVILGAEVQAQGKLNRPTTHSEKLHFLCCTESP